MFTAPNAVPGMMIQVDVPADVAAPTPAQRQAAASAGPRAGGGGGGGAGGGGGGGGAGGRRGGGGGRPAAAFRSIGWEPSSLRRPSSTQSDPPSSQLLNVLAEAPLDRLADGDIEKLSACFDVPRYAQLPLARAATADAARRSTPPKR